MKAIGKTAVLYWAGSVIKNYIVSAVRPIREGWHIEKHQELYKNYREMYNLSVASYRKFVEEPFEAVLLESPVDNNYQNNLETWQFIHDLWHREPCNILWAGADTFMTQPTSLFSGRYPEYRLFNYTDPRSFGPFAHHFNDDVQLYPHTMSQDTWQRGQQFWDTGMEDPAIREWGFDQLRHNAMFWNQDIPDDDRCHPHLNFICMNLRTLDPAIITWHEQWNRCEFNKAHILHFCASRGSASVIAIMKELATQFGVAQ